MKNSRMIDINRMRALTSYSNIEEFKKDANEKSIKKMRGYCRKLPAMIQTNGLIEMLVFIKGKISKNDIDKSKKNEYEYIYEWIESWMKAEEENNENYDLLSVLMKAEDSDYRKSTDEVMNILLWYKRNAEGIL